MLEADKEGWIYIDHARLIGTSALLGTPPSGLPIMGGLFLRCRLATQEMRQGRLGGRGLRGRVRSGLVRPNGNGPPHFLRGGLDGCAQGSVAIPTHLCAGAVYGAFPQRWRIFLVISPECGEFSRFFRQSVEGFPDFLVAETSLPRLVSHRRHTPFRGFHASCGLAVVLTRSTGKNAGR